jgi:hypothetical protein
MQRGRDLHVLALNDLAAQHLDAESFLRSAANLPSPSESHGGLGRQTAMAEEAGLQHAESLWSNAVSHLEKPPRLGHVLPRAAAFVELQAQKMALSAASTAQAPLPLPQLASPRAIDGP